MTDDTQDEGFGPGDCVRILGSKVTGFVTGEILHIRRGVRYFVEYVDAQGNPQEREWDEGQLSLVRPAEPQQAEEEVEITGTVVPFPVAS